MTRRSAAFALAAVLGATGCAIVSTGEPAWVRDRAPLPSCGEVIVHGDEPIDPDLNRCLGRGRTNGRGAELVVRARDRLNGLPVDSFTRVYPDGTAELILHLDPERSGPEGWERHACGQVELAEAAAGSLTFSDCEQTTPALGEGR